MSQWAKGVSVRSRARRNPFFFSLLVANVALVLACSSSERKADRQTAAPAVRQVDVAGIKQAVERHRGRVVLLDIWATWCGPCLTQYPYLAKWQAKYGSDNLAIVSVSIDDLDDLSTKVIPFLAGQKTDGTDLLLYAQGDHDTMVNAIDPDWAGEVPALFLYDRDGRLRHSLTGEHEPAEVQALLDEMLRPSEG